MANLPNDAYIFCPEYGLEPALRNINIAKAARDESLVIVNKNKMKQYVPKSDELIAPWPEDILYRALITLTDFNGYPTIYVARKTKLYFENVPFDFVDDKWKFKELTGHPLNKTKFNIYDRPKIKSILDTFLTKRQDEVFELMYRELTKSRSKLKFINILNVVVEYQDRFLDLLVPYEEKFLDVPDGLLTPNDSNGMNGANNTDGTNTNGTGGKTTATNNNLWLGLGLLAVGTYALKKKKVI